MSNILWSSTLVPSAHVAAKPYTSDYYGESLRVPLTKNLALEERTAPLPDRKVYRSMSRAGVLLSVVCLDGQQVIQPFLDKSPFCIGIYAALENGPVDLKSTLEMIDVSREDFAEQYKKHRNPKMFLMQLPNLAAAQMGIFLGILGPLNVYNSSTYGSIHALEHAEMDLHEGRVDAALVCSAFSFENPLILERIRRQTLQDRILCEGAAELVLTADGKHSDWKDFDYNTTESYYGISHQIITQIQKKGE